MKWLKGKSSLMIFDKHTNLKYKYVNRHFFVQVILCGHSWKKRKEDRRICVKPISPPWGGVIHGKDINKEATVFQFSPPWRGVFGKFCQFCTYIISILAPVRRRRHTAKMFWGTFLYFNSRPREEASKEAHAPPLAYINFNSRPREEASHNIPPKIQ